MPMVVDMGRTKVGGQALADGVLMRTDRAWAIARADGSLETGVLPPNRWARVPILRVLMGLGGAIRLGIGRGMLQGARRLNRRYLYVMLIAEVALVVVPMVLPWASPTGRFGAVATLVSWFAILIALRMFTPPALWRYHGAEHKAVAAYDAGCDAGDVGAALDSPRIHDRCGTNLVVLMVGIAMAMANAGAVVQIAAFTLGLAAAVEILGLAARWPYSFASRAILWGGKAVQRHITTSEPTRDEQVVACRALAAAIQVHTIATAPAPALAD